VAPHRRRSSAGNPHPALGTCINGRPDLQGPLCQALVDYHGVFHVISAGRCNHAGASRGSGPIPAGDGNTMLVGWEIDYNGVNQQMTSAQYNASLKATVAVLRRLGRDASYARGHRETSVTGKIDPYAIDLNVMRSDVARLLNPPPGGWSAIVDNATAGRFTASANWGTSTYSGQRYGADYRFANPVAASDPAWYKFAIPETGTYRVEAWWPANSGYNNVAPYIVVTTTGNAVCRPSMPGRAADHSQSLASTACGAWSVATQSSVPSASARRSAAVSADGRSGGLTLCTGS